ncbi:uncharacterized protein B0T15DRAFT_505739 [Chaetomium strumarium]|uniref:Uncharacterized protein n=1 Tax=Chaetomium strumarium TaxID=1170767 RepID=A0AAJ0GML1_9PEZI|nr:hypothetical protein B0T15DRAFT_505739 [Chaetomium strumarium]
MSRSSVSQGDLTFLRDTLLQIKQREETTAGNLTRMEDQLSRMNKSSPDRRNLEVRINNLRRELADWPRHRDAAIRQWVAQHPHAAIADIGNLPRELYDQVVRYLPAPETYSTTRLRQVQNDVKKAKR